VLVGQCASRCPPTRSAAWWTTTYGKESSCVDAALVWKFGDGHLHDQQLVAALQDQCRFEAGEVRVIVLESQPFLQSRPPNRIVVAVAGQLEKRRVVVRRPWLEGDGHPVTLTGRTPLRKSAPRIGTASS
jgi:hypothetical protein